MINKMDDVTINKIVELAIQYVSPYKFYEKEFKEELKKLEVCKPKNIDFEGEKTKALEFIKWHNKEYPFYPIAEWLADDYYKYLNK